MGLFKKKEENITVEDTDVTATVDTGRRFSVIIEGITTMLDGNGSIITGQLFGKIKKGDKVYVYMATAKAIECEVQAVEATIDGRSSIVDEAEDTTVSLQLTLPDDANIKKYAKCLLDSGNDKNSKLIGMGGFIEERAIKDFEPYFEKIIFEFIFIIYKET